MKNPASLPGRPPLLLVVVAWACVVGAVGVEGVAGGASQDSWGSCKTPVCGEVQRQAEALINLRLFRSYIAQTVLLINTQLGLLDEEVVKTAEGLTQFIGPQCPTSHDLLLQVTQQAENLDLITKDDVREVLTDNPVEEESTTTQQFHDSHHVNKDDNREGHPYNPDEDYSPTTQQSEDYDTEDESQHLPTTKHTTASGFSRNDLLESHSGSGKALTEHSIPKDVGSGSGIDSSSSTGKITTSSSKITTSSSSSTQQSVYVAPGSPKEDGRGGQGVTVPAGSGGTFVTRGSSGVGRGTYVPGGSSGASHGTFVNGESTEAGHGTFLPGRSSVGHGEGSRGSQGRGIHVGVSGGYGESGQENRDHGVVSQGSRGYGGGGRSIHSSGSQGGGSQGSRGYGRGSHGSGGQGGGGYGSGVHGGGGQGSGSRDGRYSEWYYYCRGVSRGSPHWVPGLDEWCVVNCANGHCPPTHCIC